MRKQDMENQFSKKTRKKARSIQAQRIFRSRWFKSLVAMGSVVVFCTVYSLIIPAATLTEDQASADAGIVLEEAAPSEPQPVEAPAETPAPEPVQEEAPKEEPIVQAAAAVEKTPAEQAKEATAAASSETVTETPAEAASTAASTEQSLNESAAAGSGSEETKTENAETANTAAANETAPTEETSGTATDETATEGTDAALTTEETTEEASTADSEESVEETTGKEEEVGTVSELKGTSGNLEAVVRFAEGAGVPENATLAIYGGSADTGKVQDALWSGSMDSIEQSTITTDLSEYVSFAVKDVDGNDITPDSDCSIEISFGSEADLSDPGENRIKKYGTLVVGSDGNVSVTGTSLSTGDGHTYATFSGKLSGNTFGFAVTTADKKVNYLEGLSGKTSDGAVEASLTFGKDAKVPEGSTLTVESASVSESSVLDKLWGNYEGVDKDTVTADDVQFVKFVIRDKDGKEISPETKVSVKLTFHHEADLSSAAEGKVKKYNALAVSSDGTITLGSKALSAENGTTIASFADVSAKSAFGYAVTTAEKKAVYATRLTGKSEDGTIEASLRLTEEAKIPEGSLLKITPVTGETVQKTLLDNIWTDTSIIDPDTIELTDSGLAAVTITDKDGNALKPEADATLTLTFNKEADLKEAARKMVKRAKTVAMTEENVKLSDDGLSAAEGKTKVSYTGIVDGQTFGYAVSTAKQKTNFLEGKLTYEGEDYTIEVSVNKDNQIPEGSGLKVKELDQDSEEFKKKLDQAAEAVQKDAEKKSSDDIETTIDDSSVRMFDITILNEDGDEIQPNGDVSVSVQYKKAVKVSADAKMKAIHFDEKNEEVKVLTPETKADTSDTEKKVHEVKFDTNGFSVYAIVGTEEGTTFTDGNLTADGDGYHITVSYDADAEIPEGAVLDAREITGDEAKAYAKKVSTELNAEVTESRFFDLHILDKDGNKIQPKTAVKIKITYDKPFEVGEGQKIQQVHFKDSSSSANATRKLLKAAPAKGNNNDNIEVLDVKTDSEESVNSVEFTQDSFSVTGTVVTSLAAGWPDEGYYSVIVKSGNNYYAVGLDGTLTPAIYDASTKKVSLSEVSDKSTLSSYRWELIAEEQTGFWGFTTTYHYLRGQSSENSGAVYIDPYNGNGISSNQTDLHIYQGSLYYRGYYLSVSQGKAKLSHSSSYNNSVEVLLARDFTASGSDTPGKSGDEPAVDLGAPATKKELTSNGNGTYKLTLSVTGRSQAQQSRSTADVVIVFDRSGSMQTTDAGDGNRRDTVAISATKTLADALLENNTNEYPDTVRIGIVRFNNNANTLLNLINDKDTIDNRISSSYLGAQDNTGTNWEDALQKARTLINSGRSDAAKYVIFVSDGNPTYWVRTGGYGTGGTGYETVANVRTSYERAKDDAKSLVDSNISFYTLGVFGNASRMSNLTAYAYSGNDIGEYPSGHYQTASDTASLTEAFANIINEINKDFAFTDVSLTDGITDLTSTAAIADGTAGAFTYSGTDTDGNVIIVPDKVKTAYYDTNKTSETYGSVVWKFPEDFQLPNGTTYKVEFTVWPKQQAYDVIAALQNGSIIWNDENATVNGQAIDWSKFERSEIEGSYTYSYRTNTSQTITYRQITRNNSDGTTITSDQKTSEIYADPLPAMPLDKSQITVQKIIENSLDKSVSSTFESDVAEASKLSIGVKEDNNSSFISRLNPWKKRTEDTGTVTYAATAYIAPGLIRTSSDGAYKVLETGHDYQVTESGANAYHWNLEAGTYRPMVIGTQLVMLRKVDSKPGSGTYYQISDSYYVRDENASSALTATNKRASDLNLTKKVTGDGADANATFTFNVNVKDANGSTVWFSVEDGDGNKVTSGDTVTGATAETRTVDSVTSNTGYYYAASEANITVKMKAGWNLRFTNLPVNSTYTFTEQDTEGYKFVSTSTKAGSATATSGTNKTTKGTIGAVNTRYTVTYINTVDNASITIKKVSDDGTTALSGAKFTLLKKSGDTYTALTGDEYTNFTVDADGKTFKDLVPGDYRLTEISAPDGYIIQEQNTDFKIHGGSATAIITKADSVSNALISGDKNDTISIKNTPGQALPSTGGPGTNGFLIGGLAVILGACTIYFISKKRFV